MKVDTNKRRILHFKKTKKSKRCGDIHELNSTTYFQIIFERDASYNCDRTSPAYGGLV